MAPNQYAGLNEAADSKLRVETQKALLQVKTWPPRDSGAQNKHAAEYASIIARDPGKAWVDMAGTGVCWDGVMHCALKTGIIGENKVRTVNARDVMVTVYDSRVSNANQLRNLGAGMVLGFFSGTTKEPVHVMLTTGQNRAAGMKNNCVGIGDPYSWQELDLAGLSWEDGKIRSPLQPAHGLLTLRYREISRVGNL